MSGARNSPWRRLSKLRAMSAREIAHRVAYRAALAAERRQHAGQRLSPPSRLRDGLTRALRAGDWKSQLLDSRRRHRERFLPGVRRPDRMRHLFAARYEAELQDTLRWASAARAHQFEFFGARHDYGPDIPWQDDPVTGRPWPASYHADVPVHRGDVGCGDVKHVWELSRQQYLVDLGKAYFLTGSDEDAAAVRRLVRSWIAGNPYATGVNWACALEPAFRSFSWLWAYYLTQDALDDEFHVQWLEGFHDHARFVARHLEHYSSPYNHLVGEASALYMLGACFPEFEASARWRATAQTVIEGRLGEQFYSDGGSVEQSTFYHHATVGYMLLAALTGRAIGDEFPPAVWSAIERGLDFSLSLMQPDGRTPEIGGADDGKPIRMEQLPFWDFRPYQAIGAVLFGRGDFKHAAGRFHEDALWLLGPEGLDAFERLEAREPAGPARALAGSGYYVLRTGWSERADYACFDCGEQAAGMRPDAVPNSMHGHADCLSVVAWIGGRRVLVDSGLYCYNCGGAWEAHFRETAAHSTARVDGRDQARHLGKMAWSHSYRATLEGWGPSASGCGWAIGSHDGYARGPEGVTHRRAVWLREGGYLVVADEFVGLGEHDLEVNYQFAPGDLEMPGAGAVTFSGFADLAWASGERWEALLACGGDGPDQGWIAPSLGVRQPAPRLTLRCRTAAPRTVLLAALAGRADGVPRVGRVGMGGGSLLTIAGGSWRDWIAAPLVSQGTAVDTEALVACCREEGDVIASEAAGRGRVVVDTERLKALALPLEGYGR